MNTNRWRRQRIIALGPLVLAVAILVNVTTASAWSGTSRAPRSGYLPYTQDYIQTNTWMGTDFSGSPCDGWFDWQSSSQLIGPNPYNAYYVQDSNTLRVNGASGQLSNSGGGVAASSSQVTYTQGQYSNWIASARGYNEHWETCFFWNLTSNDGTMVRLWSTGAPVYNTASATKWW